MSGGLNLPELSEALGLANNALSSIPAPVASGALKAISRLVGIGLQHITQPLEDRLLGESQVRRALATAAAAKAAEDPVLVQRTMSNLLDKELRKQVNKDKIAVGAVHDLLDAKEIPAGEPDDDWLNVFEEYAANASDEKAQALWSKVLSGEVRKPGSYSRRTLRFLSELEKGLAEDFEAVAPGVYGDMIHRTQDWASGQQFARALRLEEAGLLSGVAGNLYKIVSHHGGRALFFNNSQTGIVWVAPDVEDGVFHLPALLLTDIGQQIVRLLPPPDIPTVLRAIAWHSETLWPAAKEAFLLDVSEPPKPAELLWRARAAT
jgi:hypothetical protein